jgi:hypothetical protein
MRLLRNESQKKHSLVKKFISTYYYSQWLNKQLESCTQKLILKCYKASDLDAPFGTTQTTENEYEIWNMEWQEPVWGTLLKTVASYEAKYTLHKVVVKGSNRPVGIYTYIYRTGNANGHKRRPLHAKGNQTRRGHNLLVSGCHI